MYYVELDAANLASGSQGHDPFEAGPSWNNYEAALFRLFYDRARARGRRTRNPPASVAWARKVLTAFMGTTISRTPGNTNGVERILGSRGKTMEGDYNSSGDLIRVRFCGGTENILASANCLENFVGPSPIKWGKA